MKRTWIIGLVAAVWFGLQVAGAPGGGFVQQRGTPINNVSPQIENGIVVGTVLNPYTKEPIDSVTVSLVSAARDGQGRGRGNGPESQTTTDSNGRFRFAAVAPGNYTVRAEREGYFSAAVTQTPAGVVSRPT